MMFKVKLITSGGGQREIEIEATSVQDARDQTTTTYKNCTILDVDLIPKKGHIRVYASGDQIELPQESIYIPF